MRKFIFLLFLFLFFLLSLLSSGVIDSTDGFSYLSVARNIYYGKGPTTQVYEYNEQKNIHLPAIHAKNGKWYGFTGLGYSLALVPSVAITDLVYKHYSISPPEHFPLENDWVILLSASFTNAFFAAFLGIIMFLFFLELGLGKKSSLLLCFVTIFTTNLLAFSKHSLAHMMFTAFLVFSLYLIKLYSRNNNNILLALSGFSFGIVMITYNSTFILALPPILLYYIFLLKPKLKLGSTFLVFKNTIAFLLGILPFILVYVWFENLRSAADFNLGLPAGINAYASLLKRNPPFDIYFEGLYGQLFSPGRSYFIYSPLIILILLFWHKLKRLIYPELILFLSYFLILIAFYSSQYSIGVADQGMSGLWHGESSWGPRYLAASIPLGMLVVGHIYSQINRKNKLWVFLPLCLTGLFVQSLGVIMPYQIKFHNLDAHFVLNGTEYPNFLYSNLLARYSPIFMMSKNLIKLVKYVPKTINHGPYNVRFYDGIDFPFSVGSESWRSIEGNGYISFDNNSDNPVRKLSFDLINHPLSDTKIPALITFILNNKTIETSWQSIPITQRKTIVIPLDDKIILPKDNRLTINVNYSDKSIIENKEQLLGLITFKINDIDINKETLDIPYVSPLGPKMTGITYVNWGGTNKDPWKTWIIHTQMFERLPDFWWIRNLYYWDIPKNIILLLLTLNLSGLLFFGVKLYYSYNNI